MNTELDAERTLARKAAAGDPQALQDFFDRYADPLYAFIHHQLDGDAADAEDLWQETLLAAVRSLGSYRGESRLFTWLCALARFKVADFYRQRGRRPQPAPLDEETPDAGPHPEAAAVRGETLARVVETLAGLPPDYRAALVTRYAEGRSVADVARVLDRSYKAAESLLARAKSAFQQAFTAGGKP